MIDAALVQKAQLPEQRAHRRPAANAALVQSAALVKKVNTHMHADHALKENPAKHARLADAALAQNAAAAARNARTQAHAQRTEKQTATALTQKVQTSTKAKAQAVQTHRQQRSWRRRINHSAKKSEASSRNFSAAERGTVSVNPFRFPFPFRFYVPFSVVGLVFRHQFSVFSFQFSAFSVARFSKQ